MRRNGYYHLGTLCQAFFCALLFSPAQAAVTIKITHPQGTAVPTSATASGLPPLAVPMTTSRTESTHRFERNTGAPNIDGTSGTYRWTNVTTANVFCVELAAGGDPSLSQPTRVMMDGLVGRNITAVADHQQGSWWYGDDGLGFSSVCVQTVGNEDPDADPRDIWLIYGQGISFGPATQVGSPALYQWGKRTDLEFTDATGTLGVSDSSGPWIAYGFKSGDYVQLQHASVNSGNPIWVSVTSKTSKDAIVIDGAFHNANLTGVTCYWAIQSEYGEMDFDWTVTGGNARGFTLNTDTRPNGVGTIPSTTWKGPQFTPVFDGNGTVVLEAKDWMNNETDSFTMTVDTDDNTWDGSNFYISATGDDTGGNDCTNSASPCQSFANGLTKLIAAGARSSLFVKLGDTDIPVVSATVTSVPTFNTATDKRITTTGSFGSGATPTFASYVANDVILDINSSGANLRVDGLTLTHQTSTAPNNTINNNGHNILLSRVTIEKAGTTIAISTSGTADHTWFTIHDCRITNLSGYCAYLPGNETAPEATTGTSIVGSYFNGGGAGHTMRLYPSNMLIAYNYMDYPDADPASNGGLTLRFVDAEVAINYDHRAVLYNNIHHSDDTSGEGGPVFATTGTSSSSKGNQNYHVVDGNYITHDTDSGTGNDEGIAFCRGEHIYVRNNVIQGYNRAISISTANVNNVRVENNTGYTEHSSRVFFRRFNGSSAAALVRNLLVANNAIEGCSTSCIENSLSSGTEDARPYTHVLNNNFDVGASTHIRIRTGASSASYSVDATGTAWTSVRPGQTNQGGDGANAVDCDFVNEAAGNFELNAGSPCINVGMTTYPIIVDHRGNSRITSTPHDIGAVEYDSAAPVGTCCACDNSCTDAQEAACEATPGSIWTTGTTCAVEGCSLPTGACCTTVEGDCSIITDACCAATQWLTGGVCTSCEWQCCHNDGTCTDETEAACDALTNAVFTWGTSCSGSCTTEACCNTSTCTDRLVTACAAQGGTSMGGGTTCAVGAPCAAFTSGSCCAIDGSCAETVEAACSAPSVWTTGADCSPNDCEPAGACCLDDQTCEDETEVACAAESGTGNWLGSATTCAAGLCNIRACCDGEDCTDTIEADCAFVWHDAMVCSETPCVVADLGSCCDYRLGNCEDELEEVECAGTTQLWMEGGTCAIDPCVETDIVTNGTVPAGTTIVYPETTIRPGVLAGRWVFEPQVNLVWLTNASGQSIYAKINDDIEDEASAESGDYVLKIPNGMMAEVTRGGTRKVHVLSVWVPTSGDRDGVGVSVDWRKPAP